LSFYARCLGIAFFISGSHDNFIAWLIRNENLLRALIPFLCMLSRRPQIPQQCDLWSRMLERRAISSIPGRIPSIVVAASDAQER
jgi:hypothetical protein